MATSADKAPRKADEAKKAAIRILAVGSSTSAEILTTLTVLSTSASNSEQEILDQAKKIIEARPE